MIYSSKVKVGIFRKLIYYSTMGAIIGAASYAANRLIQEI